MSDKPKDGVQVDDSIKLEESKKSDQNERVNEFIAAYGELVKKYRVDFASYPVFMPDGQGGFKILVQTTAVDMDVHAKKSPFVASA